MTIKELIKELESYYDQDAEVIMMGGFTPKRVVISDKGKYADIIADVDLNIPELLSDVNDAIDRLESADFSGCDDESECEDAAYWASDALERVAGFLEDII